MFKGVEIKLAGPICDCNEKNLGWRLERAGGGRYALIVLCLHCKTELLVNPEKFKASIRLDTPYPERKIAPPKETAKETPKQDGNVIQFRPKKPK